MRLVRRGSIAIGWLTIAVALLRIGSGGGGTAENIRYAIWDLTLLVIPAALTLAAAVALVVGVLTDRRIGRASLAAALLAMAVGIALERSGHGSGVPVAVAASVTAALSIAEARADRVVAGRGGPGAVASADEPDSGV